MLYVFGATLPLILSVSIFFGVVQLVSYPPRFLIPVPFPVPRTGDDQVRRVAFWEDLFSQRKKDIIDPILARSSGSLSLSEVNITRPENGNLRIAGWLIEHRKGDENGNDGRNDIGSRSSDLKRGKTITTSKGGKTVFVLVHGAGGSRAEFDRFTHTLLDFGDTLAIDTRDCGTSEGLGAGISYGYREKWDVFAAIGFARDTLKAKRIVLVGTSAGGSTAIMAAGMADHPRTRNGTRHRIDAVVSLAPYASLETGIAQMGKGLVKKLKFDSSIIQDVVLPFVSMIVPFEFIGTAVEATIATTAALASGENVLDLQPSPISSMHRIHARNDDQKDQKDHKYQKDDVVPPDAPCEEEGNNKDVSNQSDGDTSNISSSKNNNNEYVDSSVWGTNIPVMIVHGTADPIVPYSHAKEFRKAGAKLCTAKGAGHNASDLALSSDCRGEIRGFLESVVGIF